MNARAATGWVALAAAGAWLYYDYQAKADPNKIDMAIKAGWVTVIAAILHVMIARNGLL